MSVAWRVFGRAEVHSALSQIMAVLDGWGYQTAKKDCDKLHTTIAQTLLVNRSPLLEDLSTEVLTALRDHPAIGRWGRSPLYGIHRPWPPWDMPRHPHSPPEASRTKSRALARNG